MTHNAFNWIAFPCYAIVNAICFNTNTNVHDLKECNSDAAVKTKPIRMVMEALRAEVHVCNEVETLRGAF